MKSRYQKSVSYFDRHSGIFNLKRIKHAKSYICISLIYTFQISILQTKLVSCFCKIGLIVI